MFIGASCKYCTMIGKQHKKSIMIFIACSFYFFGDLKMKVNERDWLRLVWLRLVL